MCVACTVRLDGRRVLACLTIEELASGRELHAIQAAFIDRDSSQCGCCTPGQIMSGMKLLEEGHADDDAEIAEWMSGNICRCAAYPNIRAAIRDFRDAAGGAR
jgi:xanthine dehydrogenase YagT iron-sulfur-binding subunit